MMERFIFAAAWVAAHTVVLCLAPLALSVGLIENFIHKRVEPT